MKGLDDENKRHKQKYSKNCYVTCIIWNKYCLY